MVLDLAKVCKIPDCNGRYWARGYCSTHYSSHWKRSKDPTVIALKLLGPPTDGERFAASFIPEPNSGCWLWLGNLHRMGYGRLKEGKRVISAHRFAYEYYRGTIPNGLVIDHLCRVPSCVNPWHMEVVTNTVNILRGEGFSARNAKQTHCIHGHLLAGENLQIVVRGTRRWRKCKACEQRRSKERNSHYANVKNRVEEADTEK